MMKSPKAFAEGGWHRGAERLHGGGRGGSDGIFCMRQALKKRREREKKSRVLFVDLVKAFNSVPMDVRFTLLAKIGAPPHLSALSSG